MWKDLRLILDSYYRENGDFSLGGMNYSETRDTLSEYLSAITDSARRIESIVRSLKDYARQDQTDMNQRVDINAVVRSGLNLLSSMLKKSTAKLAVNLKPDLTAVRGNSQRLEQVIVNIIQNACQALENRNQGITISTGFDEAEKNIVLQVCDEGIGIPAQDIDKIKDPFFTSKRSQGGTGLGLSVTSAIIQEHGGTLRISSEVNRGTTVTILFPANLGPKE